MNIKSLLTGFITGVIATALMVFLLMPGMMIQVHKSRLGFDETVSELKKSVEGKSPWKVPIVVDIQKNIIESGHENMTKVKIVTLCQPHYAHKILSNDDDKKVSTLMPLGFGVYETGNGDVYISEMNVSLMGMMFGGTIAEVMGLAGNDMQDMIKNLVQKN